MKATVTRKELNEALAIAASATSARTALPVLSSIRIEAKDAAVTLLGCDGEMWAQATLPAQVEIPGAICVQQKLLSDIVSALGDQDVSLELENTSVFLRAGQSEWKMMALPADEFPEAPTVAQTSSLTLPMGDLKSGIDGVSFAVSDDTSRPVLTGVLFKYDGETLTVVATDTHRLAVQKIHKDGIGSPVNAIVPAKALRTIRNLPLQDADPITVSFDESKLRVDIGSAVVVAQLLSGSYPNWERVVPSEFTRVWTIERREFQDNIKRAMILARDNANRVRFRGEGEKVVISSRSEEKGEAKEEVAVVSKNGDVEIAFNGKYVMEALAALPGEGVRAEMTESTRPAVLRPVENGDDHFCVVMPMAMA